MITNPCAGLLRVRTAEARTWKPLWPHFRAQLAGIKANVLAVLPTVGRIQEARVHTFQCLACRLLILGQGTRMGRYNRQQVDMVKDLSPLFRPAGRLWRLARMARLLTRENPAALAQLLNQGGAR